MSKNKSIYRYRFFFLLILGISFFISACGYFGNQEEKNPSPKKNNSYTLTIDKVTGIGRVEPEGKIIRLYPKSNGIIESVQVKMSEKVKKGQVLFVIEHGVVEAENAVYFSQIKEQRAKIKHLKVNLLKLETTSLNFEKSYKRIKEVYEQGAETKQNLDNAETTWKTAQYDLDGLNAQLEIAQSHLETILAELKVKQLGLEQFFVKAPADGIILKINTSEGAMASKNNPLGEFAPDTPTTVVTEIDELFAKRVELDQKAYIRLSGGRDTIAFGTVVELSPSLRRKSLFSEEIGRLEDRRVREVRIRLEKGQEKVLYGQRVECLINVKN